MGRPGILLMAAATLWAAGCSGAGDSTNNGGGGGNQGGIVVSVSPAVTSTVVNQTVPFSVMVTGTASTAVNWEVAAVPGGNATVGTINPNGIYTAPAQVPNPSTVVVTAVLQADTTKTGTSRVQIFPANSNQAAQNLPIELGTSGGNADDKSTQGNTIYCCAGTLGSLLERNGIYYILSNNHVLARVDLGAAGEPITQPGLIDTNCSTIGTNTVANLTSFVNLETAGTNVDVAIAQIVPGAVDTSGNILSLGSTATGNNPDPGPPHQGSGILASVGENVAKSGRSSGLTCSAVASTQLTTSVTYQKGCNTGTTFTVTYSNQISVSGGTFSADGDSGSLIVDQQTADPVALLYGGSDSETVGNPVGDVLAALQDQQGNPARFVGSAVTHSVIGCTLAGAALKAANAQAAIIVDAALLAQAQHALDLHAPELLSNPYIHAIGVGPSVDRPGEAAVVIVVNPSQTATPLPATIEGVGTRIVMMSQRNTPGGVLENEVAARVAPVQDVFAVNALTKAEMDRAKLVHGAYVKELMKQPGVQGVGITSSVDAPGEAALMIYLVRGEQHDAIPVEIEGLRTRVRETSRFTAGRRNQKPVEGCRVTMERAADFKMLRGYDDLPLPQSLPGQLE